MVYDVKGGVSNGPAYAGVIMFDDSRDDARCISQEVVCKFMSKVAFSGCIHVDWCECIPLIYLREVCVASRSPVRHDNVQRVLAEALTVPLAVVASCCVAAIQMNMG